MQKLALVAALALSGFGLYGCQTSCGEHGEPVLWADGITLGENKNVYQTTKTDDKWLHFPSYRSFRLPLPFSTKSIRADAYISFEERPMARGATKPDADLVVASGNVVTYSRGETDNELLVENGTCENDYYLLLQITNLDAE